MFDKIYGSKTYGLKTETADTVITQLVEPRRNLFTHIAAISYRAAGTAHTLTIMRPFARTTLTAAAAGAQAVINIAADPGNYPATVRTADNAIAANDYVVVELPDGTFHIGIVSSVATLAITLTANLPTLGAASGAKVWFFGVAANTNPNDAQANPTFTMTASAITTLGNDPGEAMGSVCGSFVGPTGLGLDGKYEPLLVQSNNATAQGFLESVFAVYTNRG
jgi:hypothetical protein